MRDILRQLLESLDRGEPVAYCRLVETRGSTPQKAGALMLVYLDGSQHGTLGGGCVEAEVKRRALAVLARGEVEVAKFQLDSDYGWDDGLICGGRMHVLVEPLVGGFDSTYFRRLIQMSEKGAGCTEVVAFDQEKSGLPIPASYLFDHTDALVATSRGASSNGEVPPQIRQSFRPVASRPHPYAAHGVAYLPILCRSRLLVVGGGHVGKAVADLAADLEFDVWVIDDRAQFICQERFPYAERRVAGDLDQVLPSIEITPDTYCLIVTRGHNHDEKALYYLVNRGARYVGLIGSRRKIKMIFEDLQAEGISPEALAKVYAPVGLDIGSQTVSEIAISIAAELVAHRNRQGQVPGRPQHVPVDQ